MLILPLLLTNCKEDHGSNETQTSTVAKQTSTPQEAGKKENNVAPKNKTLEEYYTLPHIEEFYGRDALKNTKFPSFDYSKDLRTLSYEELRIVRNEVFARNGYLFKDGFLRGYFNQYDWYKPIFDAPDFKVELNEQEREFISKVKKEESKRKESKTVEKEGLALYNADLIVNTKQFTKVPDKVLSDFEKQNFSLVNANRSLPFYIYDNNAYQHIPHYITTDLYLFIMHRYFSRFLEKFEENYLSKELHNILKGTSNQLSSFSNDYSKEVEWAQTYCNLALYAFNDSSISIQEAFQQEAQNITKESGKPFFIKNDFVSYNDLKPRSHYTKSEKLKGYFKAFKWVSLNGVDIDNQDELRGFITLAFAIKNNPNLYQRYKKYKADIEKLAGAEDNLSISDLLEWIDVKSLEEVLAETKVAEIQAKLKSSTKEKIKGVFFTPSEEQGKKRLFFFSSTYSISGEVFSKLVSDKREFPKSLDVPAVFGNQTAGKILLEEYKENEKWPDYQSNLQNLQEQFKSFSEWDHNYGFKGVETALSAYGEQERYPNFMKTDAYNRKELSTALASWTHVKHDLVLYQERPWAAEGGQGGGPEPPSHYSYVEPNMVFWEKALELVDWLEKLSENKETSYDAELGKIKSLGYLLKKVAEKQLNGESISEEDYNDLHHVGATIEYILLGLLETDHLTEREKSMALITDIFSSNFTFLNVAVGHADDIYVVVPIKGEYYIARGATFSFYEFTKGQLTNDDEWKATVKENKVPNRPKWIEHLIHNIPPLEGNMQFRYPGAYYD
ncbi:hypothetical protein AVL50_29830 [Flammeovirga sp. SJP92]|nr:hypothetical protein AVL50_29830 [Flammeovirga sp. SJP92]